MKFIIRDDDLNFFSKPSDIEEWYADVFSRNIPVGFSAIPFIKPEGDAYTFPIPTSGSDEYPISANSVLAEYVRSHPLVDILQHGTTHETKAGKFEYGTRVPSGEAMRGKEELERAFGRKVSVFVPPHDWINISGVRSVEMTGMDVIRGRGAGLRNVIVRSAYFLNFVCMLFFKAPFLLQRKNPPAYPFVLNFGKHKELCSYRLEDEDIFEMLEYVHRKNGVFVVVTHLHFYTKEKKERLLKLIAHAQKLGAEFITPSDAFN